VAKNAGGGSEAVNRASSGSWKCRGRVDSQRGAIDRAQRQIPQSLPSERLRPETGMPGATIRGACADGRTGTAVHCYRCTGIEACRQHAERIVDDQHSLPILSGLHRRVQELEILGPIGTGQTEAARDKPSWLCTGLTQSCGNGTVDRGERLIGTGHAVDITAAGASGTDHRAVQARDEGEGFRVLSIHAEPKLMCFAPPSKRRDRQSR
jgi:hypothetical protein